MTRRSGSRWQAARAALVMLALGAAACTPKTLLQAYPSAPLHAAQAAVTADVTWLGTRPAGVVAAIRVPGSPSVRIARAALVQAKAAYDDCPVTESGCDPMDSRFATGTSAEVIGGGPDYLLLFPSYGGFRELAGQPQLLLDVMNGDQHYLLEIDLSRVHYRASNWGVGGGIRYRPPTAIHPRLGHTVTLAAGGERWLGITRLHLGYELGLSACRPGGTADDALCNKHPNPFLFGGVFDVAPQLRLTRAVTLGVGLGYEVLWVGADHALIGRTLFQGPRLQLQLLPTPPVIPRFADEPPKLRAGLALALELLSNDHFANSRLGPSIAWSYGGAF